MILEASLYCLAGTIECRPDPKGIRHLPGPFHQVITRAGIALQEGMHQGGLSRVLTGPKRDSPGKPERLDRICPSRGLDFGRDGDQPGQQLDRLGVTEGS